MSLTVISNCFTEADRADYRRNVALSNVKAGYDLLSKHAFTIVAVPLAAALLVCFFVTCSSSLCCADRFSAHHLACKPSDQTLVFAAEYVSHLVIACFKQICTVRYEHLRSVLPAKRSLHFTSLSLLTVGLSYEPTLRLTSSAGFAGLSVGWLAFRSPPRAPPRCLSERAEVPPCTHQCLC
jgi:hypothetical protein